MASPPFAKNRSNKLLSLAMTSQPTNESELQLYRVLQRANLLSYYDTFICQGGDDVQQLCEAGEEEFLEIMALVGMASKPLHVRRLQKALQEWVSNPAMFQTPLVPGLQAPPPSSHSHSHPSHHTHHSSSHSHHTHHHTTNTGPPPTSVTNTSLNSLNPSVAGSVVNSNNIGASCITNSNSHHSNSSHITNPNSNNSNSLTNRQHQQQALAAAGGPPLPLPLPLPSGASVGPQGSSAPGPVNLSQHSPIPLRPSPPIPPMLNNAVSSSGQVLAGPGGIGGQGGVSASSMATHNHHHSSPSPVGGGPPGGGGGSSSSAMSLKEAMIPSPSSAMHSSGQGGGPPTSQHSQQMPPLHSPHHHQMPQGVGEYCQPSSPLSLTPVLVESQIQRLSEAAEMLIRTLPPFEPKPPQTSKKKISKELEYVMNMAEDDPRRMDEIRKYAAIYGRFDCKRKPEKPLTLHEVSVNEAAAQICRHIPALLTRRDELFPLARQVVRDSGYQYSKGHSSLDESCRSHCYGKGFDDDSCSGGGGSSKRPRLDPSPNRFADKAQLEEERRRRQERLESIVEQLKGLGGQQEELKARLQQTRECGNFGAVGQVQLQLEQISTQQMQLINEQSELSRQIRRLDRYVSGKGYGRLSTCSEPDKMDTDDTDSQFSAYSNTSSPTLSHDAHDSPSQDSNHSASASLQASGLVHGGMGACSGSNVNNVNSNSGGSCPTSMGPCTTSDMYSAMKLVSSTALKKGNVQITKQLVQETLMDEGLRVVKELANQIKQETAAMDAARAHEARMESGGHSRPESRMGDSRLDCRMERMERPDSRMDRPDSRMERPDSRMDRPDSRMDNRPDSRSMDCRMDSRALDARFQPPCRPPTDPMMGGHGNGHHSGMGGTGRPRGRPPTLDRDYKMSSSMTVTACSPSAASGSLNNNNNSMMSPSSSSAVSPVLGSPNGHSPAAVSLNGPSNSLSAMSSSPATANGLPPDCTLPDGTELHPAHPMHHAVAHHNHHHSSHHGSPGVSSSVGAGGGYVGMGSGDSKSPEDSLNALLAMSQKGIKQEPSSPTSSSSGIKLD